uniref:Uncharacterized protein n=1 Tax=Rhizophora mucronata TaxID=61149 RepID=A0A2P2JZT7_RHIMU
MWVATQTRKEVLVAITIHFVLKRNGQNKGT